MAIRFECSNCSKKLRAPEKLAGKKAKCPDCGTKTLIPEPRKQTAAVGGGGEDLGFEVVEEATPSPEAKQESKGSKKKALKPCPECEEMIPETAIICRFCGEKFDLASQVEKQREEEEFLKKQKAAKSNMIAMVIFLLVAAGIGGAIFMMNQ